MTFLMFKVLSSPSYSWLCSEKLLAKRFYPKRPKSSELGLKVPVGAQLLGVHLPMFHLFQCHLLIMTPLIFRMKIMFRASHHSTVIQTDINLMTNYCWWRWGIQRTILVFYCWNQKCLPSCMWPTYGKLGLRQAW